MTELIHHIGALADKIENDAATPSECAEWLDLNSNGNPIRDKAIATILAALSHPEGGVPDSPGRYRMTVDTNIIDCPHKEKGCGIKCASLLVTIGDLNETVCLDEYTESGAVFVKLND